MLPAEVGLPIPSEETEGNRAYANGIVKSALTTLVLMGIALLSFDVCISIHLAMYWRMIFGVFGLWVIFFSYSMFRTFKCSINSWFSILIFVSAIIFSTVIYVREPPSIVKLAESPQDLLPFCKAKTERRNLSEYAEKLDRTKRVIYRTPNVGSGNRFNGLVSSFGLALAMNRSFYIDWTLTSRVHTPLSLLFDINQKYASLANSTKADSDLNLGYCLPCVYRPPRRDYLKIFKESNYSDFIVESTQFYLPLLYANRNWSLCSLFDVGDSYRLIFELLLKPSPQVGAAIKAFERRTSGSTLIGLQIRVQDRYFIDFERVADFLRCAANLAKEYENAIFFVASDDASVKVIARKAFGNKFLDANDIIKSEFNLTGTQEAILDILFLAKCKELILTPYSTFGAVAAGISGVVPHFIERKWGVCIKDLFSAPKFQYWHGISGLEFHDFQSSDMINQYDTYM